MRLLSEMLPAFYKELEVALREQQLVALSEQLPSLTVESWAHDADVEGLDISIGGTRPLNVVEKNIIGLRHGESIGVDGCEGMVVIDTDNFGRIESIEVIGRPDISNALKKIREHEGK